MCLLLFKEDLYYGTKEEQSQLLQKVLAANDTEAEEERMVGEMLGAKGQVRNKNTHSSGPVLLLKITYR